MNCLQIQALLSAHYDGELAEDQRCQMLIHVDECVGCSEELVGFEKLSAQAAALDTPAPPERIWSQIKHQLDRQRADDPMIAKPAERIRLRSLPTAKLFALAATVLVAVGFSWLTYQKWFAHDQHVRFAAEFGHYLEEFRRDPDAAQQILLTKYESQRVAPDQTIELVGYRPAVADGLPDGYSLISTHVLKMPCCTCVQSICQRSDGSTLAVFEHNDKQVTNWFGDRREMTVRCNDKQCCLVKLEDRIAASWRRGPRHITMIGVRDVAEVDKLVAWWGKQPQPVVN